MSVSSHRNWAGFCFSKGVGTEIDHAKAFTWFQRAAKRGLPEAERNLGLCWFDGLGTSRNVEEGVSWLIRAAEKGNIDAMRNLVEYYKRQEDASEVEKWTQKIDDSD